MKAARSKSKTLKLRINGKGLDLRLGMKEREGKIIYITTNIHLDLYQWTNKAISL